MNSDSIDIEKVKRMYNQDIKMASAGFVGCDDEDAKTALALIDSIAYWISKVTDSTGLSDYVTRPLAEVLVEFHEVCYKALCGIQVQSKIRCVALGREYPSPPAADPKITSNVMMPMQNAG